MPRHRITMKAESMDVRTAEERKWDARRAEMEMKRLAEIEAGKTTLPMWRWNREEEGDIHKKQFHQWKVNKTESKAWTFKCVRCGDLHTLEALPAERASP